MLFGRLPADSSPGDRRLTAFALTALSLFIVSRFSADFRDFTTRLIGNHGDVLAQHLICAWQWRAVFEGHIADIMSLPSYAPFETGLAFSEPLTGIVLLFAPVAAIFGSVAAYNAALIGSFVLTALAVYVLVKEVFESETAGIFAAAAIPFVPWRTFHFTTLNILTIYFGIFGMAALVAWVRRGRLRTIVLAALLFHVQFLTVPQVGIVLIYTTLVWLAVHWLSRRCPWSTPRALQIAAGGLTFVALGLPWLNFFAVAERASRGLLRTHEMEFYALDFAGLSERTGLSSWLGLSGVLGFIVIVALIVARIVMPRALPVRLKRGSVVTALGIGLGGIVLFVLGLGAYRQVGDGAYRALPGLFAFRHLPLLDALRVPSRLAALTPVWLAMFSSALWILVDRLLSPRWPRWGHRVCLVLPLALVVTWPRLPTDRMAPIEGRPSDLQAGEALSKLPQDAVILPIPIELHHSRASHVEEWVLKHKRRQIAGDKARVPNLFFDAQRRLGGWPLEGNEIVHAFGATHVVAPTTWFRKASLNWSPSPASPTSPVSSASSALSASSAPTSASRSSLTPSPSSMPSRWVGSTGYRLVERTGSFGIFEVLDASRTTSPSSSSGASSPSGASMEIDVRIEAPKHVASGQRMTIARWRDGPVLVEKKGFRRGKATWRLLREGSSSEPTRTVSTFHFLPSFWGTEQPERINVPAPETPGIYALTLQAESTDEQTAAQPIIVEVLSEATTFTTPIRSATLEVTEQPVIVRANQHFKIGVRVRPGEAEPIWLATSVADMPDSLGAVRVAYAFRQTSEVQDRVARPANGYHALNRDLLPTETATQTWYLEGPSHPGHFTLWARLEATGIAGNEMLWVALVEDLVAE
ncbi:MAG: hypothetical protein H6729_08075 [Deltaproteobacteria bacterium]|nr:hypothetical protein [Deltaproteobacteria bacterium]